jgi:uncharacterized SAM-binding protein YcdF (DUF218 family)
MFYVLSKVLVFLLSPVFWIALFFVLSWRAKNARRKKRLKIAGFVLLILFTNPFLFNIAMRSWQTERKELPKGKVYDAVILLSGMAMTDRYKNRYFGEEGDRFIQAARLYHQGHAKYMAVTGGKGGLVVVEEPEGDFLYREMIAHGIPADKVLKENRSRNTYENGVYIKQVLDSMQLKPPYLLVTSALHMPRSIAVFKKLGVEVVPYPSSYKAINDRKAFTDYFVPEFHLLREWRFFIKEIVGLWAYKLSGKA